MDGFAGEDQSGTVESATRLHHRQLPTSGVRLGTEAELSKVDRFPQGLLRHAVRRRDTFMMHKHEQTETLVAQKPASFCGLRFIAQPSSVHCIQNPAAKISIMTFECTTLNLLRLQAIPVMNQFLTTLFQHNTNLSRASTTINHRRPSFFSPGSDQMSPAELVAMILQMTAGRVAIADDDTAELITEKIGGNGSRAGSSHGKQGTEPANNLPQPGFEAIL